jgi:uncharacterized protein (DUF1697 family)
VPRFIAFVRAINAGRGRVVKMEVLRQAFKSLGFAGAETFIASGNVVFDARSKNTARLERRIERGLRNALRYDAGVFIRTNAELSKIASFEPFRQPQVRGTETGINIILLKEALDPGSRRSVLALKTATDTFRVRGREIYWLRRQKPGTSIFSTVPLGKILSRSFTVRSARTLKRLAAKYRIGK